MNEEELSAKLATWRKIQEQYRDQIRLENSGLTLECIKTVGAMDISYIPSDPDGNVWRGYACLTLSYFPSMLPYFQLSRLITVEEPYVSGYLAFRESGALVKTYQEFTRVFSADDSIPAPDVLLIDGCGIYHERKFGSACQVGLSLNMPTIGVSKTPVLLDGLTDIQARCDKYWETHPHTEPMPIYGKMDQFYGYALRGPTSKKPCYVSPGHLISPELAVEIIKQSRKNQELDPIKLADKGGRVLVGQVR